MSARDIHYGRRGGRWSDAVPGEALAAIREMRLAYVRSGGWPDEGLALWDRIAAEPDHPAHAHALEVVAARAAFERGRPSR